MALAKEGKRRKGSLANWCHLCKLFKPYVSTPSTANQVRRCTRERCDALCT